MTRPQYVLSSTATLYNAAGQVTSQTDQYGFVTETTYDLRGQAIQTRRETQDETGQTAWLITCIAYDAAGRAIVSTDSFLENAGETVWGTRTSYDKAGRVTKTERLKNVVINLVGTDPNLSTEVTDPGTVIWEMTTTYDNAGRVTQSTDRFGAETLHTYNDLSQQVETRTQVRDETGTLVWRVTRTVYDSQGRVQLATNPFLLSADGQETLLTATITGSQTIYDDQGRGIENRRLRGVDIALIGNETSVVSEGTVVSASQTIYGEDGQVLKTIDPAGREMEYEYDTFRRRIATIDHLVEIDVVTVRHRMETVYDSEGNVFREITGIRQLEDGTLDRSDERITELAYDEQGRQIKTTRAVGTALEQSVHMQYDDLGRLVAELDLLGLEKSYEYDDQGRLAAVLLPEVPDPNNSNALTRPRYEYRYNARGNMVSIRDPLYGHSTVDPTNQRETTFTFDERGNQISRTLPDGSTETFEYDDDSRQILHVSFEGVVTETIYDDSLGSGCGCTRTGRMIEHRFFDNLTQYNGGNGTPSERRAYVYDAYGQEVEITHHREGGAADVWRTEYDAEGRVIRLESPQGDINYEYDLATGRRIRTFTGETGTYAGDQADPVNDFRFTYDILSRLKTVEVYERNNVAVDVDAGTAGNQPETTTYAHDLLGNLDLMTTPDGVITDYFYDVLNRLDEQIAYRPDGTPENLADNDKLTEFDYTVRADGKRTAATENFWYDSDSNPSTLEFHTKQIDWTYDDAGRLTDEVFNHYEDLLDQTEHFTYDLTGNRLQKTLDKGNDSTVDKTISYTFDENDRMLSESIDLDGDNQADRVTTYGYDATQQTSKDVFENGVLTASSSFEYDLQGRMAVAELTTYTSGNPSRIDRTNYKYDPRGIRNSALHEIDTNADGQVDSATLTEYLNDPRNHTGYSQVLQEAVVDPATGEVQKRIVYALGHDEISQTTITYSGGTPQSEETLAFHHDGHGSVRVLTNMAAAILQVSGVNQIFSFTAYGESLGFDPALAATSLLYSGEQFDVRIGQQHLRARYYNAATGTFNRLDPFFGNLKDPLSLHKYLYTYGDPINQVDPTGLTGIISTTASIGISANVDSVDASAKTGIGASATIGLQHTATHASIRVALAAAKAGGQFQIIDTLAMSLVGILGILGVSYIFQQNVYQQAHDPDGGEGAVVVREVQAEAVQTNVLTFRIMVQLTTSGELLGFLHR